MGWEALLTATVLVGVVAGLAANFAQPDLLLLGGLTLLLAAGVVTPAEAFEGFSNRGVLAIAALLVVAAGVRETGGLDALAHAFLGRPKRLEGALARMTLPVAALSAFVSNTAVVAMGVPVVLDWARRLRVSPSRLLLPLSYAAILGGLVTLVGTSTNLVVAGLVAGRRGEGLPFFGIAVLGVPVLLVGLGWVVLSARRLLPDRAGGESPTARAREYSVTMRVERGSPLAGRSVEDAGLRHLPGLYLSGIERDGRVLPAVAPDTLLHEADLLRFVGRVDSVADLRRFPGLVLAEDQAHKLSESRPERCLVEAVVSAASPLVGRSVRAARFRTVYDAAILAVHRHGLRIGGKVGDIILQPGDTLLLEAHPTFPMRHRNDADFLLVSDVANSRRPRRERAGIALTILVAMVALAAFGILPLVTAALLAAGAMVLTGCLTGPDARNAVDLRLLLAIAAAMGVGVAVEASGLGPAGARALVSLAAALGPVWLLVGVYLLTAVATELITNAAAAALVFPLAAGAAEGAGVPLEPVAYTVMVAASASFVTPIGYQTNLMVYGPGGYRLADYVRFGLPLQTLVAVTALTTAWLVWF